MRVRVVFALVFVGSVLSLTAVNRAQTPAAVPTFSKDVAPILYKSCVSCHRPGEIGPMSLISYDDVRPYARGIGDKVASGQMPPWHAEGDPGTFLNDRRLTQAEKDTIVRWASNGAPKGDTKDLPPAPTFAQGWEIGTPDAIVAMPTDYEVQASGTVDYQYFEAPTNFTEDKWVRALEIRPGARSVVHHVLVFSREPAAGTRPTPYKTYVDPNAPKPAPKPNEERSRPQQATPNRGVLIATTAPGTNAQTFRPGTAMLIKAGSVLTFQVHYTANGAPTKDRSSIGFVFVKEAPQQEIRSGAFLNSNLFIPAGASDQRVDATIEFTQDSHIESIFPHTHLRGKNWEYRLQFPDGRERVVLSVPRYDFNWQTYYDFAEPISAPKGARLLAIAHYDNSAANKSNPDPKVDVRWGEQTWEEMQYTGITYTIDGAKAAPTAGGQQ